jgi:hypothetical protein
MKLYPPRIYIHVENMDSYTFIVLNLPFFPPDFLPLVVKGPSRQQ